MALLPIVTLFAPWTLLPVFSFHSEWLAMFTGLVACLAAVPLLINAEPIAIPKVIGLPLFLLAYIGFQNALLPQVVDQHAQMAMLYLLWAAILLMVVNLLKRHLGLYRVSVGMAIGLTLAAALAGSREFYMRLHGEFGNWGGMAQANNYGDLLMLGVVALFYWHHNIASTRRPCLWILAFAILLGLSLTPSRGVWLYWSAVLLLAWFYQRAWLRDLLIGFMGYLALLGLWGLDFLPQHQSAIERFVQEIGGAPLRLHIWAVAWQLFMQNPLLGNGFGQFDWAYFQHGQHIPELSSRIEHAHNLILHFLAELGLLPTLILTVCIIRWLKPLVSLQGNRATDNVSETNHDYLKGSSVSESSPLRAWLLMSIAVVGIHSMLEYPLWYTEFLGIASMFLALGETRSWIVPIPKATWFVISGILVVSLVTAVRYERQYTRMELALLAATVQPTQQRYDKLISECRDIPENTRLLLPYVPVIFTLAANAVENPLRAELATLTTEAYKFWPVDKLAYREALMQALNGNESEAIVTLRLAMAAYPKSIASFRTELERLNPADRQKVELLRQMLAPGVQASLQNQGHAEFIN
ncbi:PglL family O-oligosaccharyltransferase [Methylomonas sp. 11b]|uniref:PglL family O-oligosaccharyltransferase n=1 Tax=Methylomonas sp. 11b TaxID=1168169 RepID=UPI0004B8C5D7|nr:O-antigen ligase family protein [Methylomonas sp. 11b]